MSAPDPPLASRSPAAEGLQWPAPVSEGDILWLDGEAPVDAAPARIDTVDLSRLLAVRSSIEWHEAIAVVLGIADALASHGQQAAGMPGERSIFLEPDGRFRIAAGAASGSSVVSGLGALLRVLLSEKPLPINLRLFVSVIGSDSAAPITLEQLLAEVGRWERPGREQKLVDLYNRARAAKIDDAGARPPDRIEPPAVEPAPSEARPAARRRRPLPPMAVIAGAIVAASVVTAVLTWLLLRPGASPRAAAAAAPPVTAVEAQATTQTSAKPSSGAATETGSHHRVLTKGHGPKGRHRQTSAASARDAAPDASLAAGRATPAAPADVRTGGGVDSPAVAPVAVAVVRPLDPLLRPVAAADAMRIFHTGEPGVSEALLVRPHLPPHARPDVPQDELGFLELVIDTQGHVESVHLKSPANRYREKWWLFAAKDWLFTPATKDGHAVRFLKRIPLTDLNMSEPQ